MKLNKPLALAQIFIVVLIGIFLSQSRDKIDFQNLNTPEIYPPVKYSMTFVKLPDVIKYGESLWDVLRKNKIEKSDIHSAINEFKKYYNPRNMKAGDRYQLERDSSNQFIFYYYQPELTKIYKIEKDSTGNFSGKIEDLPLTKKVKTLSGTVSTTLYESIRDQGESPELILNFTDIFQWDVDFFVEPQPGDSYKIVYEVYYLGDQFVRYGHILAGQYSLCGEVMTAFYYQHESGKGGYYEWSGESIQKTFLKSPLNYRRISSYFSMGRRHPILKRIRPHYGVDFSARAGTPVVAPADGIVSEMGYQSGGVGRYLKIRHTNTHFVTLYGHLRAYGKGIKKGKSVTQRDVIGYVGSTGLATGPHLHYTFYENGRPINPLRIRNVSADPLKTEQVAKFREHMLPWLDKLAGIEDPGDAWVGTRY